jgi:HK97 family phage portal protein
MPLFRSKSINPVSQDYSEALEKVTRSISAYFGYTITNIPDKLEDYIKDGYLLNADVYTVINFIIRKVSGVSWNVYEVKDKKALAQYKGRRNKLSLTSVKARTKALEDASDSDLYSKLQKPNDGQELDTFVSETIGFLALTGNFYWHAFKPELGRNNGKVTQAIIMPSQITQIVAGSPAMPVEGYRVLYNQTVKYNHDQVYHGKLFNPSYGPDPSTHLYGLSPLRALSRMVYTSNESIEANAKILKHLGALGFLTPEAAYDGNFTETQGQILQDTVDKRFNNPSQYGKKAVVSIPMRWQSFGQSVEELAIMELQKVSFNKICNAYGLDPNLFGTDVMRDNNKQQAARDAWYNCIMYYLDKVKEGLNDLFAKTWSDASTKYYIDYDLSDVEELQKDMERLTAQIMGNYTLSINEKRAMLNYDDLEASKGGENFTVPIGMKIIKDFTPDQPFDSFLKHGEYGQRGLD